jgi:hypothetical protein
MGTGLQVIPRTEQDLNPNVDKHTEIKKYSPDPQAWLFQSEARCISLRRSDPRLTSRGVCQAESPPLKSLAWGQAELPQDGMNSHRPHSHHRELLREPSERERFVVGIPSSVHSALRSRHRRRCLWFSAYYTARTVALVGLLNRRQASSGSTSGSDVRYRMTGFEFLSILLPLVLGRSSGSLQEA